MKLFLDSIKSQPFAERYKWFYEHLKNNSEISLAVNGENSSFMINRTNVFEDSCSQIKGCFF